jgi:predicted RecA/RadA family phage recombinase
MKNFVQRGDVIDITAGSNLTGGVATVLGNSIAIPVTDIASGAIGAALIEGVVTLPKASAKTYNVGDLVDWDVSASQVDTSAATGDLTGFGIAVTAGVNGSTSIAVKLLPGVAAVHS